MTELVAFIINGRVTNRWADLLAAVRLDLPIRPIDRSVARLMAACDCGPNWKALAEAPAMLVLDSDGKLKIAGELV